jgi:hypothetical protein
MIKIDTKMPNRADLVRTAMAEVEKQIARKARDAAARHGGVTARLGRKPVGSIHTFEFQGSDAAIKAATAAFAH